jgi:hypothetical protein
MSGGDPIEDKVLEGALRRMKRDQLEALARVAKTKGCAFSGLPKQMIILGRVLSCRE